MMHPKTGSDEPDYLQLVCSWDLALDVCQHGNRTIVWRIDHDQISDCSRDETDLLCICCHTYYSCTGGNVKVVIS